MILAYFLSAFSYIAGIGLNVTSGWLITMASFAPPVLTLSVAVVMVRFFGISRSVARYLERVVSHRSVFEKLAKVRSDLYRRITSNPASLIIAGSSGRLIKQVVDDVERAQEYELRILLPGVSALLSMSAATLLAFWLQPIMGLIWLALLIALVVLVPIAARKILLQPSMELEELESRYADQLRNSVHGYLEAEIYGYIDEIVESSHQLESKILKKERSILKIIRLFQLGINLCFGAALWRTFTFAHTHPIPPVQIAMLTFLALTGFESVLAWYPNLFTSGKLLLAKEKLESIPEMKSSIKRVTHFGKVIARGYRPYWSEPNLKENRLQNKFGIDFEIDAGNALVIRGASGAGKTTIAMGLLGLIRYSGSLTIGGVEVREIENLDELVTGALQNGHIFNTSLRENLKISGNDDYNEVIKMLELEKLISELPDGLDTVIGEFGRGISGGEAKRIVLARALLSKAPLLILDEPTEHLDPDLAARITERILKRYKERALLVITHSGWSGVPQLRL